MMKTYEFIVTLAEGTEHTDELMEEGSLAALASVP